MGCCQVIVVDVRALGRKEGREQRRLVVERALRSGEQDNEAFYRNLRARMDRCTGAPCVAGNSILCSSPGGVRSNFAALGC